MSARELLLPDEALNQMLADMAVRVSVIEQRAAWPSAVRQYSASANPAVSYCNTEDIGGTTYPVGRLVIGATLEPGRWVLFGMLTGAIGANQLGNPPYDIGSKLRWQGVSGLTGHERRDFVRQYTVNDFVTLTAGVEVISDEDVIVNYSIYTGSGNPIGTGETFFETATLIAFPG